MFRNIARSSFRTYSLFRVNSIRTPQLFIQRSVSTSYLRFPRLSTIPQTELRAKKKKGGKSSGGGDGGDGEVPEVDFKYLEEKMENTLTYLATTLSSLRTERLSPSLIENILVELPSKDPAGDAKSKKKKKANTTSLRNVADISILDHRHLIVHPHDQALEKHINKALNTAEGGFSPQPHEGAGIKVPIPKMTMEFREQLEKTVNKYAEEAKESMRRTRREGMDQIKQIKASIGKDAAFREEKKVQELLDKKIKIVNDRVAQKIAEIKDQQ